MTAGNSRERGQSWVKNSSEFEGLNCQTVFIGGEGYIISQPSVKVVKEVCMIFAEIPQISKCITITDIFKIQGQADEFANALSCLIASDTSLKETFLNAPYDDVVEALAVAFDMIVKNPNILLTSEMVKCNYSVLSLVNSRCQSLYTVFTVKNA